MERTLGKRPRRIYDHGATPLDRMAAWRGCDPAKMAALLALRSKINPFALSRTIERKAKAIINYR